jgi:hypothetical protein
MPYAVYCGELGTQTRIELQADKKIQKIISNSGFGIRDSGFGSSGFDLLSFFSRSSFSLLCFLFCKRLASLIAVFPASH